jgi:hypothetical protein
MPRSVGSNSFTYISPSYQQFLGVTEQSMRRITIVKSERHDKGLCLRSEAEETASCSGNVVL